MDNVNGGTIAKRRGWLGCLLASCFTTSGLITIASVIALSLIPIYLSRSTPTLLNNAAQSTMLDVTFSTNYQLPINTSSSDRVITNIEELTSRINAVLHVQHDSISVTFARFMPQPTGGLSLRRRRQTFCELGGTPLPNSFIQMNLFVSFPRQCGSNAPCKTRFLLNLIKVLQEISTFISTIVFGNGLITVTVSLKICSVTTEPTETTTTTVLSSTSSTAAPFALTIFYSFDGNCNDLYGLYDGVTKNGATFVSGGITGYGSALSLQSSLFQYVEVASPPSLQLAYTSFTFELWIRTTVVVTNGDQGLIGQCSSESTDGVCFYLALAQSRPYMGFTPSADCLGVTKILSSRWYHLAFVYSLEDKQSSIYVNGTLDATCISTQLYQGSTSALTIGKILLANSSYFDGQIDQLSFVNRAKQPDEILRDATLVSQYTFNSNSLVDSGPNGINGTSAGTTFQESALSFTNNSYFEASGFVILGTTNFAYSFSLWIKPLVTTSGTLIQLYVAGGSFCLPALGFTSAGHLYVQQWSGSGTIGAIGSGTITLNIWTHLVYTYSENIRLYVNGVLSASSSPFSYQQPGKPMTVAWGNCGSAPPTCGCNQGPIVAGQYLGLIDKVEVYSRELSVANVQTLTAAGH